MDPETDGTFSSTPSRADGRNGNLSPTEVDIPSSLAIPVNSENRAMTGVGSEATSRKLSFSFQKDSPLSRAGLLHPKVHHSVEDLSTSENQPTRAHSESPIVTPSPRRRLSFMRRTSTTSAGSSLSGRMEADDHIPSSSPRVQIRSQGDIRLSTVQLSEMILSPPAPGTSFASAVSTSFGARDTNEESRNPYFENATASRASHSVVDSPHGAQTGANVIKSSQDKELERIGDTSGEHGAVVDDVNPNSAVRKTVGNNDTSTLPYKSGLSLLLSDSGSSQTSPDRTPIINHPAIVRTGSTGSVLTITPSSQNSADDEEVVSGSPTPVPTALHSPTSESPQKTAGLPSLAGRVVSSSSQTRPPPTRQRSVKWDPNLDTHSGHPPHHMSPPPPDIEASPLLSYHETQPLLHSHSSKSLTPYGAVSPPSPTPVAKPDLKKLSPRYISSKVVQKLGRRLSLAKKISPADVKLFAKQSVAALPAVLLGCLLNILDGVSYGMLIFPTSEPFTDLGPMGVSLFFISAVVSQFVYTLGGSGFAGANGSMMIEVVPFFHILAQTIASDIGVERAKEVVATTLVAYMMSSLLTGLAFLLLGALKLGVIIGFFPRHILVGCIGGVGVFLLQTGLSVSLRIPDDDFVYNWDLVKTLFFNSKNLLLWGVPAGLAVLLRLVTMRWKGQLVFPIYFVAIPIIFYVVVASARLNLVDLRRDGWVFDVGGGEEPWWKLYEYFDASLIHWGPLWATLPTQFALLFFNILHPPLNVPALSVSLDEDINTNKELVGHGYSNLLSGMVGSVPNYLVYVNTLLFYRVGGGTRVAGFLLGLANILLLWIGTGPIKYLPVCVVGALIFVLGWDLVKEAVWDTRGRVSKMEFITIVSIMVAMTVWDFVIGVLFGIVVSCFFFVVQNSQRRSIRLIHTGETAMSTVRRPSSQRAYIKEVSKQTTILRLQGFLFFGTITYVEEAIRRVVERHLYDNPVRFLVLDMTSVAGLDMSSAEAFVRVHRMLSDKGITMVFCGFGAESEIGRALSNVDVVGAQGVELFESFGDAIEWTENCYLRAWFKAQKELVLPYALPGRRDADSALSPGSVSSGAGSPRRSHLNDVGFRTIANDIPPSSVDTHTHPEPYNTLVKVFSSFGDVNSEHLLALVPYLQRISVPEGHVLWKQGDESDGLYIIESGVLRASYRFSMHSASVEESMVSGTLAGELSALSDLERNATVWVERDAVVWKLGRQQFERLGQENPTLEKMVVRMVLKSAKVDYDILLSALASRQ